MKIKNNILKLFVVSFICVSVLQNINANSTNTDEYDKLFYYLENRGISIGEDISSDELFEIVTSGNIYLKNGEIDISNLKKELKSLMEFKKIQYDNIHKKLNKNPNNKINKEITNYFKENNDAIQKTQDDLSSKDNNGWFSSIINSILELLKN